MSRRGWGAPVQPPRRAFAASRRLVARGCPSISCPGPRQNRTKPRRVVVIGSDFQKTRARLPFGSTTISPERGINLSFARRSRLKTPINERLNFILVPLWRSLYGHDSEMDATIGASAQRPTSPGNEYAWIRSGSGHAILARAPVPIGHYDWRWRRAIGALMLPLSGSNAPSYRVRAYLLSLTEFQVLFLAK